MCCTEPSPCVILLLKIAFNTINSLFLFCGLFFMGLSVWVLKNADRALLNIPYLATAGIPTQFVVTTAKAFVVVGLVIFGISLVGALGVTLLTRRFMILYEFSIALIIIITLLSTVAVAVKWNAIHDACASYFEAQIKQKYTPGNAVIYMAWNMLMVHFHCCGSKGPADFASSRWILETNNVTLLPLSVPLFCCAMNGDPTDPHVNPVDIMQCQKDASQIPLPKNSSALYLVGCYDLFRQRVDGTILYIALAVAAFVLLLLAMFLIVAKLIKFARYRVGGFEHLEK